jgi:hypothetical protein
MRLKYIYVGLQFIFPFEFSLKHQVDLENKGTWLGNLCQNQLINLLFPIPQILMEVGYHSFGEEKTKK